jgi:hypothetical protein
MSDSDKFVPPEPGGFVPPEPGGFVPDFLKEDALAGAETQGSAPSPETQVPAPDDEPQPVVLLRRKVSRTNSDQLGIVWLRGTLHIGVRRQRKTLGTWSATEPVRTVEEFAAALDKALAELKFEGTDTFLVYEGDQFTHQPEAAPTFSASAAKAYLDGRIARYVKERGPVLWVAQPTIGPKEEKAFLLHLMPQSFYNELRRVFLPRRLDLTRILPMIVPLQREMNGFPIARGTPALVAAELGEATIIIVAQSHGPLLFTRTILASLEQAPERVAIEINRSLLYAKQQFNASVDRIWLVTRTGRATEEVTAKCGAGKVVMVLPTQPDEWVANASRVVRNQPVNLIAGYLRRKRHAQFIRYGLIAIGWLTMANFVQHLWQANDAWRVEKQRLLAVQARESELADERDRLQARNQTLERERNLRQHIEDAALPPVPAKVLGYLAGVLPADARLTEFSVRWSAEDAAWLFLCEGVINGDDETARETIDGLKRQLERSPLRVRFNEAQGPATRMASAGYVGVGQQRFNLEGRLFEN